jgi:hypothetical protein
VRFVEKCAGVRTGISSVPGKTNFDSEARRNVFGHYGTTMKQDCSFGNCQSESASPSVPIPVRFHAIERLEYLLKRGVRNSKASVSD